MATKTTTRGPGAAGERADTDNSPEAVEEAKAAAEAAGSPKPGQRAEVSNLDIVRHYFDRATEKLGLPDDLLRNIAIALLFIVAATLLFPSVAAWLERPFARLTRYRAGGGGFLLGASLGLVFVPCAGPVLAAIATVAATNNVTFRAVAVTMAYALGAALPMLHRPREA